MAQTEVRGVGLDPAWQPIAGAVIDFADGGGIAPLGHSGADGSSR